MHILKPDEASWPACCSRPLAAVLVRVLSGKGRRLMIDPDTDEPIVVLRTDALLAPLPEDVVILASDEETVIEPAGRFYITTETFNPWHLVVDDPQGVVRR